MGRNPFPIRGNVVRLSYDSDTYKDAISNFYELMWKEASAVSMAGSGRTNIHQMPDVYYWRGAVLTYGTHKQGNLIEIQKDGEQQISDLVGILESEMQVKFRRKTVSKS